jgi:hypothetical protein
LPSQAWLLLWLSCGARGRATLVIIGIPVLPFCILVAHHALKRQARGTKEGHTDATRPADCCLHHRPRSLVSRCEDVCLTLSVMWHRPKYRMRQSTIYGSGTMAPTSSRRPVHDGSVLRIDSALTKIHLCWEGMKSIDRLKRASCFWPHQDFARKQRLSRSHGLASSGPKW